MNPVRRIVFDISMAKGGGGFTYAVNVIPVLARRLPEAEILVITRNAKVVSSLPILSNVKIELLGDAGFFERMKFLAWTAPRLASEWGAGLYFSASELSPVGTSCPKIAAFRNANLFTELRLGWPVYQRLRMRVLRFLALYSARTCSRVLFVSGHSAKWIGDQVEIPDSRRVVVPHGIRKDVWAHSTGKSPIGRDYILTVSSIYRYKNFVRLIEAWTTVARRSKEFPDLVIVGDDQDPVHSGLMRSAREKAGELGQRIHFVGEVPYADIARYYTHALAFVFPSYLETFGHPLLEAMAAGIPVVASNLGVFEEVGGDAAIYFDPHDTESMATAIERVVVDSNLRESMVSRGRRRVELYSWENSVSQLIEVFNSVESNPQGHESL